MTLNSPLRASSHAARCHGPRRCQRDLRQRAVQSRNTTRTAHRLRREGRTGLQQGPHTRVTFTTRSWLDAGTEVLPGDRSSRTMPSAGPRCNPSFARKTTTGRSTATAQPAIDMGGYPQRIRCS